MRNHCFLYALLALVLMGHSHVVLSQAPQAKELPEGVERLELTIDGVLRTGLVYAPAAAREKPTPVVFAFHGHGGTAVSAGRSFAMHRHWPEAISVYLQGLNTPGMLTDPEGKKSGWQHRAGDQGDRDLRFVDATLAYLKANFRVEERCIFSMGHSNGGGFTYLLWSARPKIFAAMAPSAAAARAAREGLEPKAAMHIAGTQDPLVKYAWQKATIELVMKSNGCEAKGMPWGQDCTLYPSSKGAPFVAFIHQGDHKFPPEAPALIARFFKEQAAARLIAKPAATAAP